MSFCPVCGRDHEPGPCPMPSVEPSNPDWESKQYMRICVVTAITGAGFLLMSLLLTPIASFFQTVGFISLLIGCGTFVLARKKKIDQPA